MPAGTHQNGLDTSRAWAVWCQVRHGDRDPVAGACRDPDASPTPGIAQRPPRCTSARAPRARRRGRPPGRAARKAAKGPTASRAPRGSRDRPDVPRRWPCACRRSSGRPRAPYTRMRRADRGRTRRSGISRSPPRTRHTSGSREAPARHSGAGAPRRSRARAPGTKKAGPRLTPSKRGSRGPASHSDQFKPRQSLRRTPPTSRAARPAGSSRPRRSWSPRGSGTARSFLRRGR